MHGRTRTNVVKNRQFSERIEEAMARYHNRLIDALQMIRKYSYPPDLEDAAIRTVVLQAEALAAEVKA